MRTALLSFIGLLVHCTCVGQGLEKELNKLFFQLPVSARAEVISAEMEKNSSLSLQADANPGQETYKVLKSATFVEHPAITTTGFKNELALAETKINEKPVKELSMALHYRAEDKAVYESVCRKLNKAFRPYFKGVEKNKNSYSFAEESTTSLFKNKDDKLPLLKITSRQTFTEINNPKKSVYSLIISYQQVIE